MTLTKQFDMSSLLEVEGEFSNTVLQKILGHMEGQNGILSLRDCASQLGTSPRSLQRHLAREDCVYDDLTMKVKKYTVCNLIQTKMLIRDIATVVGFKDHISLNRFTTRHWGLNPRSIKALLKADVEFKIMKL